ncbi:MAG: L,D-transpeptidase [Candidatus Melainabacteria bacterium]|nr:L,D-transpeptidase [Candidatus Melainabacteria bacterium]
MFWAKQPLDFKNRDNTLQRVPGIGSKPHSPAALGLFAAVCLLLGYFSPVGAEPSIAAVSPTEGGAASQTASDSRIVINIPSRTLQLWRNEHLLYEWPVGVGRRGFPTPLGQFRVLRKVQEPGWQNPYHPPSPSMSIAPGRESPLGTRWIGFHQNSGGEYGIHGTDRPDSVGQFSSHGCIRMRDADVEHLFEAIRVGTPVWVTYHLITVTPGADGESLILRSYPDHHQKGAPSLPILRRQLSAQLPNATETQFPITDAQLSKMLQWPAQLTLSNTLGLTNPPKPTDRPSIDVSSTDLPSVANAPQPSSQTNEELPQLPAEATVATETVSSNQAIRNLHHAEQSEHSGHQELETLSTTSGWRSNRLTSGLGFSCSQAFSLPLHSLPLQNGSRQTERNNPALRQITLFQWQDKPTGSQQPTEHPQERWPNCTSWIWQAE